MINLLEKAFARVVKKLRADKGLSQETLAFESELHRTYVSQLERGIKSPSLKTISRLAKALGVTASDLVRRAERST